MARVFKDCDTLSPMRIFPDSSYIISILYANTEIVESDMKWTDVIEGDFPLIAKYEYNPEGEGENKTYYTQKTSIGEYKKGYNYAIIRRIFHNDPTIRELKEYVLSIFKIIHQKGHDTLILFLKDKDRFRNELEKYNGALKKIIICSKDDVDVYSV